MEALTAAKGELDALKAGVPADGAYELTYPEGFDGADTPIDPQDPLLDYARKVFAGVGISQEQFSAIMQMRAELFQRERAAKAEIVASQLKQLGPQASPRMEAIKKGIDANFGPLAPIINCGIANAGTDTAAFLLAAEQALKTPGFQAGGQASGPAPNEVPEGWNTWSFKQKSAWTEQNKRRQAG